MSWSSLPYRRVPPLYAGCGVVYDPSGLNEKGYIYAWLYRLLTTRDQLVTTHTHTHTHTLALFSCLAGRQRCSSVLQYRVLGRNKLMSILYV